ncbi:DUF397 domain-containing protein [Streptomyces sp. NBC_00554]|uniref:DUF397 domain-containing protein n=1 Tax=Streptomyces sp. NBC_00554 TaxID=2903661 RepID=UPI00352DD5BE|nr:DUF397 domain-containing protein [Streptomyces sp. NBC_00554]
MNEHRLSGAHWFKSSYSSDSNNACIEVAVLGPAVGIRDSKDTGRRAVTVPPAAWRAFVAHVGRR